MWPFQLQPIFMCPKKIPFIYYAVCNIFHHRHCSHKKKNEKKKWNINQGHCNNFLPLFFQRKGFTKILSQEIHKQFSNRLSSESLKHRFFRNFNDFFFQISVITTIRIKTCHRNYRWFIIFNFLALYIYTRRIHITCIYIT